ncbi:MAG: hypothetical protein ACREYF_28480 [Gammaproteobacteria bacterium]
MTVKDLKLSPIRPTQPVGKAATVLHTHLTLIEVAEPELLDELCADRRLGPLIVTRLSDHIAAVAPGRAQELIQALLKAGHTPKLIET